MPSEAVAEKPRLSIGLTPEIDQVLRTAAKRKGQSLAAMARLILSEYFAKELRELEQQANRKE